MKKFFITATGTGVGKTFVSAILCQYFSSPTQYVKPIQTGVSQDNDALWVKNHCSNWVKTSLLESFDFPASPHFAASLENKIIKPQALVQKVDKIIQQYPNDNIICEGAGGIYVPITDDYYMFDLMSDLSLKVILIADSFLGTLNHTFTSIDILHEKGVEIFGVILNNFPKVIDPICQNNLSTIKNFCQPKNIRVTSLPTRQKKQKFDNYRKTISKKIDAFFEDL